MTDPRNSVDRFRNVPRLNGTVRHNLSVQGAHDLTLQTLFQHNERAPRPSRTNEEQIPLCCWTEGDPHQFPSTKMDAGRRSGVEITESLLRKRAEHNDGRLDTLEEISLHQQVRDVEANGRLGSAAARKSLEDCFRDGCADGAMWAESHGNQSDSRETVLQPQNPLFARKSDSTAGKSPSLGGAEVLERGPQPDRRSQRT